MKKIAILLSHSPFDTALSREANDMIMALAAVEHQITVIYQGAGVLQLLSVHSQATIGCKDYTPMQKLFELYEVTAVIASSSALAHYHIDVQKCLFPVMSVSDEQIKLVLAQQQHILRF